MLVIYSCDFYRSSLYICTGSSILIRFLHFSSLGLQDFLRHSESVWVLSRNARGEDERLAAGVIQGGCLLPAERLRRWYHELHTDLVDFPLPWISRGVLVSIWIEYPVIRIDTGGSVQHPFVSCLCSLRHALIARLPVGMILPASMQWLLLLDKEALVAHGALPVEQLVPHLVADEVPILVCSLHIIHVWLDIERIVAAAECLLLDLDGLLSLRKHLSAMRLSWALKAHVSQVHVSLLWDEQRVLLVVVSGASVLAAPRLLKILEGSFTDATCVRVLCAGLRKDAALSLLYDLPVFYGEIGLRSLFHRVTGLIQLRGDQMIKHHHLCPIWRSLLFQLSVEFVVDISSQTATKLAKVQMWEVLLYILTLEVVYDWDDVARRHRRLRVIVGLSMLHLFLAFDFYVWLLAFVFLSVCSDFV